MTTLFAHLAVRYSLLIENIFKLIFYLEINWTVQICRVAYELMQQQGRGDMTERAHSLDDIYYFGGQHGKPQRSFCSVIDNRFHSTQLGG